MFKREQQHTAISSAEVISKSASNARLRRKQQMAAVLCKQGRRRTEEITNEMPPKYIEVVPRLFGAGFMDMYLNEYLIVEGKKLYHWP